MNAPEGYPRWTAPHPTRDENPADVLSMRLQQAEALATVTVGEEFETWAGEIQHNLRWLLSGLVTEARIAADQIRGAK